MARSENEAVLTHLQFSSSELRRRTRANVIDIHVIIKRLNIDIR